MRFNYVKDTLYQAKSDGFVAAYTGGNSPADELVIEVGDAPDRLNVRTRAGRYDGTICPVSRGDHWVVRSFGEGSITVHWLPSLSEREMPPSPPLNPPAPGSGN